VRSNRPPEKIKNKQMKNKFLNTACWLIAMIFIGAGCEKGPQFREFTYPAQSATGMNYNVGFPGMNVTIKGTNFDTLAGAVKVWFGGILATNVVFCRDTQIVVQVPATALSGKVGLQVWTTKTDSIGSFKVIPTPEYKSISATRANPGDVITFTGKNFLTNLSAVKAQIGYTQAEIVSNTDTEVKFKVPNSVSGTPVVKFNDYAVSGPFFFVGDEQKITGTLIGHTGSYNNNTATTIAAAVDGKLTTYVDAPTASGYVGYDVGAGKTAKLTVVRYAPRSGNAPRMIKGEIRGSNDATLASYDVLYKITQAPAVGVYTETVINTANTYRYVYYYAPEGSCNIAEIEFIGKVQ
jgi:hypothetical protein